MAGLGLTLVMLGDYAGFKVFKDNFFKKIFQRLSNALDPDLASRL